MTPEAERFNGWAAMLGFVAAVGIIRHNRTNRSRYFLNDRPTIKNSSI